MATKTAWIPTLTRMNWEVDDANKKLNETLKPKDEGQKFTGGYYLWENGQRPDILTFTKDYFKRLGWDDRLPDFDDPEYDSKMRGYQTKLDLAKTAYDYILKEPDRASQIPHEDRPVTQAPDPFGQFPPQGLTGEELQQRADVLESQKPWYQRKIVPGAGGAKFSLQESLTTPEVNLGLGAINMANPAMTAGTQWLSTLGKAANVADLATSGVWGAGQVAATVAERENLSPMEMITGIGTGAMGVVPGLGAARRPAAQVMNKAYAPLDAARNKLTESLGKSSPGFISPEGFVSKTRKISQDRPAGSGAYYKPTIEPAEVNALLKRAGLSDQQIGELTRAQAVEYAQSRKKWELENLPPKVETPVSTTKTPVEGTVAKEKKTVKPAPMTGLKEAKTKGVEPKPVGAKTVEVPAQGPIAPRPFDVEVAKDEFYQGYQSLKDSPMSWAEKKKTLVAQLVGKETSSVNKAKIVDALAGMEEADAINGVLVRTAKNIEKWNKQAKRAGKRQKKAEKMLGKLGQKEVAPAQEKVKGENKGGKKAEGKVAAAPKTSGTGGRAVYETQPGKTGKTKFIDVERTGRVKGDEVEVRDLKGRTWWAGKGRIKEVTPEVQAKVEEQVADKIDENLGNKSVSSSAGKKQRAKKSGQKGVAPEPVRPATVETETGGSGGGMNIGENTTTGGGNFERNSLPLGVRLQQLIQRLRQSEPLQEANRRALREQQAGWTETMRATGDWANRPMTTLDMEEAWYGAVDITHDEFQELITAIGNDPKVDQWKAMQARTGLNRMEENAGSLADRKAIVRPDKEQYEAIAEALRGRIDQDVASYTGQMMTRDQVIQFMKDIGLYQTRRERIEKWLMKRGIDAIDVLNIPRVISASFDLSAPFQQGFIATLAHPVEAARDMKKMLRAFGDLEYAETLEKMRMDLNPAEYALLVRDGGLEITPLSMAATTGEEALRREEPFASKFLAGKPGIKNSQYAFLTYLNELRYNLGKRALRAFAVAENLTMDEVLNGRIVGGRKVGLNHQQMKDLKDMMSYINVATGRGYLPGRTLKQASPLLNMLLFSPKFLASRLEFPTKLFARNKWARQQARKDMAIVLGFGASVLAAAKALGAEVDIDPRSSEFAKVKVGNTRLEIFGGYSQYLRTLAQMVKGQREKGGKISAANRWEVLQRFGQGKSSPMVSLIVDMLSGKNYMGEKMELTKKSAIENVKNRLTPMAWQALWDAMVIDLNDDWNELYPNWPSQLGVSTPNILGMASSTYEEPTSVAPMPTSPGKVQPGGLPAPSQAKPALPSPNKMKKQMDFFK